MYKYIKCSSVPKYLTLYEILKDLKALDIKSLLVSDSSNLPEEDKEQFFNAFIEYSKSLKIGATNEMRAPYEIVRKHGGYIKVSYKLNQKGDQLTMYYEPYSPVCAFNLEIRFISDDFDDYIQNKLQKPSPVLLSGVKPIERFTYQNGNIQEYHMGDCFFGELNLALHDLPVVVSDDDKFKITCYFLNNNSYNLNDAKKLVYDSTKQLYDIYHSPDFTKLYLRFIHNDKDYGAQFEEDTYDEIKGANITSALYKVLDIVNLGFTSDDAKRDNMSAEDILNEIKSRNGNQQYDFILMLKNLTTKDVYIRKRTPKWIDV